MGCGDDGCVQAGGESSFDPADTVHRVGARLLGTRWPTAAPGLLEVTNVEIVSAGWPITLRLTVANDDWPDPRTFLVESTLEQTLPGTTPDSNAEAMAEDCLILIERHLVTGHVERLVEPT